MMMMMITTVATLNTTTSTTKNVTASTEKIYIDTNTSICNNDGSINFTKIYNRLETNGTTTEQYINQCGYGTVQVSKQSNEMLIFGTWDTTIHPTMSINTNINELRTINLSLNVEDTYDAYVEIKLPVDVLKYTNQTNPVNYRLVVRFDQPRTSNQTKYIFKVYKQSYLVTIEDTNVPLDYESLLPTTFEYFMTQLEPQISMKNTAWKYVRNSYAMVCLK